ncbi:MAG: DUF1802 family protein [Gemmataceae bacterium]|nr:DUF1802 family protein [Gemmataceae bacterium]MDW8264789.1 DUF1802 family protein [Gemmataceae bacterium]
MRQATDEVATLRPALKEWAVICRALALGRQAILLRKGGVAEPGGGFELAHRRFWLYPTYVHQQRGGIRPEAEPLLEEVEADRPPQGRVRLSHFADVRGVYDVRDLPSLLVLAPWHVWSEETVRSRFAYRRPGLYVVAVQVWRVPHPYEVPERPEYAGCRSWLDLAEDLPTAGAQPVLGDDALRELLRRLDTILNPTALA